MVPRIRHYLQASCGALAFGRPRMRYCDWLIGFFGLLAAISSSGCGSESSGSGNSGSNAANATASEAEQVAEKMLSAYRNATSFSASGSYVQQAVVRGEGVERSVPMFEISLQFARPNRLYLQFREAGSADRAVAGYEVACDGVITRSAISAIPDQIHEVDAPAKLTTENFLPAQEMRDALLLDALGDAFPNLAMLLNEDDAALVFPLDSDPTLLEQQELRGRICYRLATKHPSGRRVLWIDQEDYRLHRMELPIEGQEHLLDPSGQTMQMSVYLDFEEIAFDVDLSPTAFRMELPLGAHRVTRFVEPAPLGPPAILGKRPDAFEFTTIDGQAVAATDFRDKTTVLDFWQISCRPCKQQTPTLEEAAAHFADRDDVAFRAVGIDDSRATDQRVASTWQSWGGKMPVLRDQANHWYDKLDVRLTPTLLILDPDGRVQYVEAGMHESAAPLIETVERIAAGDDLAAEAIEEHQAALAKRQEELEAATIRDALLEVDIAQAVIAPQLLPSKWKLEELWSVGGEELNNPGNVLTTGTADSPTLLAIDGGAAVVELDAQGQAFARHELPPGAGQANGILRTATDDNGRRWYAVSGVGWKKAFVFDDLWNLAFEFPMESNPGIAGLELFQTAEAKLQLCVGFWGGWGVHGVAMDGERSWADRSLDQVVHVSRSDDVNGSPALWCVSDRGTISELTPGGDIQRQIPVGDQPLMAAASGDLDGDSITEHCGLAVPEFGQYRVVFFDHDGTVTEQFDLPRGEYSSQVERIQVVPLPGGESAWMVAAADGSLRWFDRTGELIDQFDTGAELRGAAMTNSGDGVILVVSSPEKLTAWRMTPAAAIAPAGPPAELDLINPAN